MSFETADVANATPSKPDQAEPNIGVIAIIVASVIGSICLILADILGNPVTSTTVVAKYVQVRLPHMGIAVLELFAILLMMLIGLGLCYVFRPKSLPGAFARSSGLHGVLFAINTFGGLAGPALAATVWVPGADAEPITYTFETPESYGPLGLGTRITGRSSARIFEVAAIAPVEISDCLDTTTVGKGLFCSISRMQAETLLGVDLPNGRTPVWVQINTPGWVQN